MRSKTKTATVEIVRARRRQARSSETRKAILEAARAVFAQGGFEGATTRSIAERANLGHNLLVYHFKSMRGIWQAVMTNVTDEYRRTFNERLAGLRGVDPVTTLRLLQADFITLAAEQPEFHWLMAHEAGQGSERTSWLVEQLIEESVVDWKALIKAAQDEGGYVEGDPIHLHYLFVGAASRIFMLRGEVERVFGRDPLDRAFIQDHINLCNSLFFRDPVSQSTSRREMPTAARSDAAGKPAAAPKRKPARSVQSQTPDEASPGRKPRRKAD